MVGEGVVPWRSGVVEGQGVPGVVETGTTQGLVSGLARAFRCLPVVSDVCTTKGRHLVEIYL